MAMDVRARQFPLYSDFMALPPTNYTPLPQYRYTSHESDFVGGPYAPAAAAAPAPAPASGSGPVPVSGYAAGSQLAPGQMGAQLHAPNAQPLAQPFNGQVAQVSHIQPHQVSPPHAPLAPHAHAHAHAHPHSHSHPHASGSSMYPPSPPHYPQMRMLYPSYPREAQAPSPALDSPPRMMSFPSVPFSRLPSPFSQSPRRAEPLGGIRKSSKRAHNCMVCGKVFARPSALQTHFYSHTGEKPFKCEHAGCGRSFSVVSNLRRHNQKVHDEKRH